MTDFTIGISPQLPVQAGKYFELERDNVLGAHPNISYDYFEPSVDTPRGRVVAPVDIANFDAVLVLAPIFRAESFSGDDRLAIISRWGVGYDRIDVDACTRAGVLLAITTEAVRRPVAEAVVTLVLTLAKCVFQKDRIVRQGRWDLRGASPAQDLRGKTFGMVGLGNIGAEVFRLLAPFELGRRIAYDPYVSREQAAQIEVELVNLETLFTDSDFVSINTPLTDQTRGLVDRRLLQLMKPTAYLVNTARGPVVVQDDLVDALKSGSIAGAGLDVFDIEPLPADHPLTELDNVVLAPHSLAWTDEIYRDNTAHGLLNILEVFQGRIPKYTVNPHVLGNPEFQRKLKQLQHRWRAATS